MLASNAQTSSLVANPFVEPNRGRAISVNATSPFSLSPLLRKTSVLKSNSGATANRMVRQVTASAAPWSGIAAAAATASPSSAVGLTVIRDGVSTEIGFSFPSAEAQATEASSDLLVVAIPDLSHLDKGESPASLLTSDDVIALDKSLGGVLSELSAEPDFKAKAGQLSSVVRISGQPFKRVALLGLGKPEASGLPAAATWQSVGSSLASASKTHRAPAVAVLVVAAPPEEGESSSIGSGAAASAAAAVEALVLGATTGKFEDIRFKSDDSEREKAQAGLTSVSVYGLSGGEGVEKAVEAGKSVAEGVILTRQLVNAPPNVLTPIALADVAVQLAASYPDVLQATILDEAACAVKGMGAYLAVGAASDNPSRFIHLTYTPPSSGTEAELTQLAIVGKGLTFDSGGYNLKAGPGSMIHLMKFDMGGAAATLGAAKAIAATKPAGVQVHFIVAACENMIAGDGMRPGDIITASNGKTIEVNNTDAEGRLTLADALLYAQEQGAHKIIDLATLTGACIVALGNDIAGLFTPHDSMAEEVSAAAKAAGEKFWRMPMEEAYWDMMKSKHADMVNTGGREGGSITAALFLKQFVDDKIPWAHLDIAGPVWSDKKGGGTGFAASTLFQWVKAHEKSA